MIVLVNKFKLVGIFPYNFVNENNLEYIGGLPYREYFPDDVNIFTYLSYQIKHPIWNLREEAIKYCIQDCVVLYDILVKFSELIWDKYQVNITSYPTLSSLTYNIYLTHFLGDNKIPMITGQLFNDIKLAYTGGSTDMFIPTNIFDKISGFIRKIINKIFYYDVNSLYPFIMSKFLMPCGKMYYFEGDIYNRNLVINNIIPKDVLGFFFCKVIAPENMEHPIIQLKHEKSTLSPIGEFEAMLYSKEIENARKYGYKITVLRGYYFQKKENLFKDYITQLYSLRKEYNKSHPMNLIAKLLMNSLYGRFGLNPNLPVTNIISNKDMDNKLSKYNENSAIVDVEPLGDHFIVSEMNTRIDNKISSLLFDNNINVAIAAAVTAIARVFMSQFKNSDKFELYYTDTDSIFISASPEELNKLYPSIVGGELGQLKLECVIERAVFLAPKAYCFEVKNKDDSIDTTIKIKGLSASLINRLKDANILGIDTFLSVLKKDSSQIVHQNKTIKNLSVGSLDIIEQSYSIKHNDNKRFLIYKDEVLVNTKPKTLSINQDNKNNIINPSEKNPFL